MIWFSLVDYIAFGWFVLCWAWFIRAWLFILAATWVTIVLYRREFRPSSHSILQDLSKVI